MPGRVDGIRSIRRVERSVNKGGNCENTGEATDGYRPLRVGKNMYATLSPGGTQTNIPSGQKGIKRYRYY